MSYIFSFIKTVHLKLIKIRRSFYTICIVCFDEDWTCNLLISQKFSYVREKALDSIVIQKYHPL